MANGMIVNLIKKGIKGRKYKNERGSYGSLNMSGTLINLQYDAGNGRIGSVDSIQLTEKETETISAMNQDYNLFNIPANKLIEDLTKIGKLKK